MPWLTYRRAGRRTTEKLMSCEPGVLSLIISIISALCPRASDFQKQSSRKEARIVRPGPRRENSRLRSVASSGNIRVRC